MYVLYVCNPQFNRLSKHIGSREFLIYNLEILDSTIIEYAHSGGTVEGYQNTYSTLSLRVTPLNSIHGCTPRTLSSSRFDVAFSPGQGLTPVDRPSSMGPSSTFTLRQSAPSGIPWSPSPLQARMQPCGSSLSCQYLWTCAARHGFHANR